MKKILQKLHIEIIAVIIIIGIFFVFQFIIPVVKNTKSETSSQSTTSIIEPQKTESLQNISFKKTKSLQQFTLTAGDTTMQIPFSPGETLYDALLATKQKGALSFSGVKYTGLGVFVTDIGALHQSNGKYLIYFINGTEASVGVSSYVPKNGDIVLWKLQ
jgi:hypothetical protein